ncbi:CatB-related O-acetyltransferase [Enterococcus cecorum]|uniref:CatB-related O-acetyltransferase n=1 Tax=Enterococcus cecorum TaxID=44008 RepID=UPI0032C46FDB
MSVFLNEIKYCIESQLNKGMKNFVIFPYGDIGMEVENLLKKVYGIDPIAIIDNHLCKYNSNIKPLKYLNDIEVEYVVILSCTNETIYPELRNSLKEYIKTEQIIEFKSMVHVIKYTKCGKYSSGPLCNHKLVKSVGAFCSFALGSDVVSNHAIDYISTHPFLYTCNTPDMFNKNMKYDDFQGEDWYFPGIIPKGEAHKRNRITIGNDVWIGANVIITNGSNIGNGVIAAAGAIITKDVPDYAIVMGVPARIVRYRYTPEQIIQLNEIQWWNWSDEKIKECYDDFFLPIESFIDKHKIN